jgi:hypothetical protein
MAAYIASLANAPATRRSLQPMRQRPPHVEGVYIMEFPSFDAAKAWYDSPACREAREPSF